MWLFLALSLFLAQLAFCEKFMIPPGDVRNCPGFSPLNASQPLHRMEVLPGLGFDNLRNLDMGQVHFYNYSTCKISADGKYLLPDNIFLIPVQQSEVDVFADVFDHWDKYTSMTATSINVDASFSFTIVNGKFSSDYMSIKTHQANSGKNATTTRVQIRHKLYTVKIQPGAQLHPTFKARVFDTAANIQSNNTEFADYLAELLVRDFGTHYVTSVDAGAILAQVDHGTWDYGSTEDDKTTKITASASANFFGKVSFSTTFTHSTSEDDKQGFTNNRTYSKVITKGGPPFRPNFTYDDWENGVADALVAIDRSGDPLHFAITPTTVPELPEELVWRVADTVYSAIKRYYDVNTHYGCTNPNSPSFQFQANIDNGKCEPLQTNFTFGGVYQKCQAAEVWYKPNGVWASFLGPENLCDVGAPANNVPPVGQKNPITNGYNCSNGYEPVLLHSGQISHSMQRPAGDSYCWKKGERRPGYGCFVASAADYQTYWCAATGQVPQNNGYLFGGFYTKVTNNPFKGSMDCPNYFIKVPIAEDIVICVSTDYELGIANAVSFGGFHSCITGNPLAAAPSYVNDSTKWPHHCPHGYMQHLVAIENSCEIDFCVAAGAFKTYSLSPPRLPPFRRHPKDKMNSTNGLLIFGLHETVWVKNQNGGWETTSVKKLEADGNFPDNSDRSTDTNGDSISTGAVAAVSVITTLALGSVIVLAVFAGRFCIKRHRKDYTLIPESQT